MEKTSIESENTNKNSLFSSKNIIPLFFLPLLILLYFTSLYSYLLFHSLAEIFSIIVACGIFGIAWNSRNFIQNNYLLFIGIAYLPIAALDLIHTLAYSGMGVFTGFDSNLPTQLWIAARYVESISLLIAPFLLKRKIKPNAIFLSYVVTFSLLILFIFYFQIFPECYVEGAEFVQELFEKILDVSGFDLPYIQEVTAWGSSRYNGWDVPKGVACVVFISEECYVKTLSEQGMAVKKLLGHCDETEWTEMSY